MGHDDDAKLLDKGGGVRKKVQIRPPKFGKSPLGIGG
jgi:hypothetical protein